jgi:hypothetical protein
MAKNRNQLKPWELSQADVDSISDTEWRYGTVRLLPPESEIPKEFWGSNIYSRIVEAMYVGDTPPMGEVTFNPGFRQDGKAMSRCIMAHLRSVHPEYEHKIAGIAYMISKIVHVTSILT